MSTVAGLKRCSTCGTARPHSEFHKCKRSKDGLQYVCKQCNNVAINRWNAAHRAQARRIAHRGHLRHYYGITADDYDAMVIAQCGRCLICENPLDGGKQSHIDHCHVTEALRGLLCGACNSGLGFFRDSPSLLRTAAAYIESHRAIKEIG